MPPLNKAIKGLRAIDKQSISELKVGRRSRSHQETLPACPLFSLVSPPPLTQVMISPPVGVKMVMRCICIMLDRIPARVLEGKVKDEDLIMQVWVNWVN